MSEELKPCPLKVRFLSKVDRKIMKPCWYWIGAKSTAGYGKLGNKLAHRIAFELFRCEIPKGLCICHKCDNPSCVRPGHLFIGTHSDNMKDASRKGRLRNPMKEKTHCKNGHALSKVDSNGDRRCVECFKKSQLDYYYRNKKRLNRERQARRKQNGK